MKSVEPFLRDAATNGNRDSFIYIYITEDIYERCFNLSICNREIVQHSNFFERDSMVRLNEHSCNDYECVKNAICDQIVCFEVD